MRTLFIVFISLVLPFIHTRNLSAQTIALTDSVTVVEAAVESTDSVAVSEDIIELPASEVLNEETKVDLGKRLENPYKFKGTELIVPGALIGFGLVGLEWKWWKKINRDIRDDLQKNDHKKLRFDDYIQFAPTVATYGLKLCGVKGKHDMVDVTIIYGTAYLLLAATLYPMKDFIRSERPNQKGFDSFPSGHTAIAFVGAEVLRREYWDVSPWIGIAGYAVAATTGFMRIYNNAHWLNDVIAGAGLGILCAEAAYWLYPAVTNTFFKKRYNANVFLAPTASPNHIGISCCIDI